MWVGLSAVRVDSVKKDTPLSINTNSGKLIAEIENKARGVNYYKTNLVKCLPIEDQKIRYPKQKEMKSCSNHLQKEITQFKPKVIFLLGKQVSEFVISKKLSTLSETFNYDCLEIDGLIYIPVHHPSYILVYRRKELANYKRGISILIKKLASN